MIFANLKNVGIISLSLVLTTTSFAFAQESDATDLSRYQVAAEEDKILTLAELEATEDIAREFFASGDCNIALPAIVEFSESANMLANIIRRGVKPFYDASRDEKDTIQLNSTRLSILASAESASNNLLRKRNEFWVMEAKCLLQEGRRNEAIPRLRRALDYIDGVKEVDLWDEARDLLWSTIGYE